MAFSRVPVPVCTVHRMEAQFVAVAPERINGVVHIWVSAPAFTSGLSIKVTNFWSTAGAQSALPITVNESVTEPAAISAAEGV